MSRTGVLLFFATAGLLIWLSNLYFTQRFSESTRADAESQMTLYSGRLVSELQRNSVVPLLLSRDTTLISALNSDDFVDTSQRLISYKEEIGAKSIVLLDKVGRIVATSERRELGVVLRDTPFFVKALRSQDTVFTETGIIEGPLRFYYSRKMLNGNQTVGVIVVEVDFEHLFDRWSGRDSIIFVTDSHGIIILSTRRQFRNQTLETALANLPVLSHIQRALRTTGEWDQAATESMFQGQSLFHLEQKIAFQGWRLGFITSFDAVRVRVNAILALELMALAIFTALGFYVLSRRAIRQSSLLEAEGRGLRALNERLQNEIAERERIEKHLKVAEQSLTQSSKLAALGEMSAAVSHELNQPLAAMRTYLAGAKLLLQRRRPEEAISSFERIDGLIERMDSITRQLKFYASKGRDDLTAVDIRGAVTASVYMMSPQLNQMKVNIKTTLPPDPILVLADQVRLEQVIVNLLRNALDATKSLKERRIHIVLTPGDTVKLTVRDNGPGIEDLDDLFEPFYTTKEPGDGVGLGLAISSDIAKDFSGRLFAHNFEGGGAMFEFWLPKFDDSTTQAAELALK